MYAEIGDALKTAGEANTAITVVTGEKFSCSLKLQSVCLR